MLKTLVIIGLAFVFGAGQASCACAPGVSANGSAPVFEHASHETLSHTGQMAEHAPKAPGAPECSGGGHCSLKLLGGELAKTGASIAPPVERLVKAGLMETGLEAQLSVRRARTPGQLQARAEPARLSPIALKIRLLN